VTAMDHLIARLQQHEGFRALVYDDATGQPLQPGDTLVGHPTIGYGWALNKLPMTRQHAVWHLRDTVQEVIFELHHRLPWITELDEVRQSALYELGYNLGISGLLGFRKMLDALRRHRYADARTELLDSRWATQVQPARREALAHMILTGGWPEAAS
jgi:lysozyme